MPRRSSAGSRRPSAPATAPRRPSAPPSRPASSVATMPAQHPPAANHAPAPQQPGLFGQMASTAAGVAVGSAVGHTIAGAVGGLFGGGSSAPVEQQQPQELAPQQNYQQQPYEQGRTCEVDARNFTRCLDENNGNMDICGWYLGQLKACQEAAKQY